MEKVRPWCGQPSDRGRLKNRTEMFVYLHYDMRCCFKMCSEADTSQLNLSLGTNN